MAIKLQTVECPEPIFVPGLDEPRPTRLAVSKMPGWSLLLVQPGDTGPSEGLVPGSVAIVHGSTLMAVVSPGGWSSCGLMAHEEAQTRVEEAKLTAEQLEQKHKNEAEAKAKADARAEAEKVEADRKLALAQAQEQSRIEREANAKRAAGKRA